MNSLNYPDVPSIGRTLAAPKTSEIPQYGNLYSPTVKAPVLPGSEHTFIPEQGGPGGSRTPQFLRTAIMGSLFGLKDGPSDRFMQGLSKGPYAPPMSPSIAQALNGLQSARLGAGLQGIGGYVQ